ncbi:hypothetical protein EVAR_46237_1 [Eumeta japonica]|uniref:Uncharacterized protein n=1 Tax=Eumeta variegata TaxID=151549 RepID=A0A4C1XN36_EUMVA|nr:hypothetical protein EVAR_46237_1 [Eumeta japonica]
MYIYYLYKHAYKRKCGVRAKQEHVAEELRILLANKFDQRNSSCNFLLARGAVSPACAPPRPAPPAPLYVPSRPGMVVMNHLTSSRLDLALAAASSERQTKDVISRSEKRRITDERAADGLVSPSTDVVFRLPAILTDQDIAWPQSRVKRNYEAEQTYL